MLPQNTDWVWCKFGQNSLSGLDYSLWRRRPLFIMYDFSCYLRLMEVIRGVWINVASLLSTALTIPQRGY